MNAAHLEALYGRTSSELIDQLVMEVDGTTAAVQTLRGDATPDKAEAMIYRFRALADLSQRITARLEVEVRQG